MSQTMQLLQQTMHTNHALQLIAPYSAHLSQYAAEASAKLYEELSDTDKLEALRKADEYISKYAGKKMN